MSKVFLAKKIYKQHKHYQTNKQNHDYEHRMHQPNVVHNCIEYDRQQQLKNFRLKILITLVAHAKNSKVLQFDQLIKSRKARFKPQTV